MKTVNMASVSSFYYISCDMAFGFYSLHQSWCLFWTYSCSLIFPKVRPLKLNTGL